MIIAAPSLQIGLGARALFIDQLPAREAIEPIACGDRMRLVTGEQMRKAPARRRSRLEPAVAPAAVEIEPRHRDRKRVVSGKSVSVRVDTGGRRVIKKKQRTPRQPPTTQQK